MHALEPFHAVYINRTFEDNDSDYVLVEGRDGIWVEKPTLKGVYNLTFEDSASASRAAQELESSEDVLSAVQNGIIDWHGAVVDDDSVSQQWALDNTGQFGGTEDADINAPEAWKYETGSAEVKIGILDSGVYGSLRIVFWDGIVSIWQGGESDFGRIWLTGSRELDSRTAPMIAKRNAGASGRKDFALRTQIRHPHRDK